jgi:hypothetical protein
MQMILISSADLTRASQIDEFDAGIFTQDEKTVKRSMDYLKNV